MNKRPRKTRRWFRWTRSGALALVTGGMAWGLLFYVLRLQGLESLQREDAVGALRWLQAASFFAPRSAALAFCKASAARRAGQLELFEKFLQQARTLGYPQAGLAWEQDLREAQSGRMLQASSLTASRSIEEQLRKVIASRSEFEFPAREALSKGLIQSFRLGEAEAELIGWIERCPKSFLARLWLGQVLMRFRQYPRAIQSLNDALDLRADSVPAQFSLAQALHASGRSAEALPLLQKCLSNQGQEPETLALMARCFHDQGELAKAREIALRVQRLTGQDPINLALLAQIDMADDRLEGSLHWARLAVEYGPRERTANHVLAEVLARMGKEDEAAAVRKLVEEIKKDWQDFERAQEQVLREPLNPAPRLTIGLVLAHNLSPQEGIRWILSALAIDPDDVASHESLAELYRRAGDLELAERHRDRGKQLTAEFNAAKVGAP